jgi:hypothetical protein
VGSTPATLHVTNASVDFSAGGVAYHLSLPNVDLTIDPSAKSASTTFNSGTNTWETIVPSGLGGNLFLDGGAFVVPPSGLPGGVNPVVLKADFSADTPGLSVNWQWATAVYTQFSTDNAALGVKPVDSNQASAYLNSDHAGTPENFRSFVTGGARGGGGSNWTGSYSGTASIHPDVAQALSSLSGTVFDDVHNTGVLSSGDTGISGVIVTLTGTTDSGQSVSMTKTTDQFGNFTFSGLSAGKYTLSVTAVTGFNSEQAQAGSQGGSTTIGQIYNILLGPGVNGVNNNFGELTSGS